MYMYIYMYHVHLYMYVHAMYMYNHCRTGMTANEQLPTGLGSLGDGPSKNFELTNPQEPKTQITCTNKCSNCKTPVRTNFLSCGHYICQACTEKFALSQLSSQPGEHIKCPISTCSFENNKIEEPLQTDVCEGPDIKAMEDDLWYDPELDDTHYRGLTWPRDEDMVTMQELEFQLDKRTLARVKRQMKARRPPPKEIQLAEGANVDEIIDVLCARVKGNNDLGLIGIYPSRKLNKIFLDTETGCRHKVEDYIKETFGVKYQQLDQIFEIAEQKSKAKDIVATGSKIAALDTIQDQQLRNDIQANSRRISADRLTSYGTVACIANSVENKKYALTTRHTFNQGMDQQESTVPGTVVSEMGGNLVAISDEYTGAKSFADLDGSNRYKAVDVAAAPLRDDIDRRLDRRLLPTLEPWHRGNAVHQLEDTDVIKRGATSGTSIGRLQNTQYLWYDPQLQAMSGEYLVIASAQQPQEDFSQDGDSGALLSDMDEKPIGMLAKKWQNHNFQQHIQDSTLAVRMDTSLQALDRCDVKITELMSYGSPNPDVHEAEEAEAMNMD